MSITENYEEGQQGFIDEGRLKNLPKEAILQTNKEDSPIVNEPVKVEATVVDPELQNLIIDRAKIKYITLNGRKIPVNKIKERRIEFSKVVTSCIILTYFIGLIIGCYVCLVLEDTSQICYLLSYIGAPTATITSFYLWKSKSENVMKIKQEDPTISVNEISNLHIS